MCYFCWHHTHHCKQQRKTTVAIVHCVWPAMYNVEATLIVVLQCDANNVRSTINEVALRRARLVLGWVTVFVRVDHLGVFPAVHGKLVWPFPAGWAMSAGKS